MRPIGFRISMIVGALVFVFSTIAPLHGLDLDLVELKEEKSGTDVTFKGQFINSGTQIIDNPTIVFTLKFGDRVVAVQEGGIRGSQYEPCESSSDRIESILDFPLHSGETGSFEVWIGDVVYDSFTYRLQGQVSDLDPCLVSGDLEIIPETVNMIRPGTLSGVSILGEFVNKTNAVISHVSFEFKLYNDQGSYLGSLSTSLKAQEILPGEVTAFEATDYFSEIEGDVARWEVSWRFTAVRLDTEVPTVTTPESWGHIKSL